MGRVNTAMAKLAGIRKAIQAMLDEIRTRTSRPYEHFRPDQVSHYFTSALKELDVLREELPNLYADIPTFITAPQIEMAATSPNEGTDFWYGRNQLQRLARDIDQIFEIRANSELAMPEQHAIPRRRVFISHGHTPDWREVQAYIEKDIKLDTLELAQEANQGRTILAKLLESSEKCDSAVIVMTGDDLDAAGQARARENVIHEIGFFQGKYGLNRIVLLHEEGVNIPSNIQGVVYTPFTKNMVSASFGLLVRELNAMYQ